MPVRDLGTLKPVRGGTQGCEYEEVLVDAAIQVGNHYRGRIGGGCSVGRG
jgi:hypothetical protein